MKNKFRKMIPVLILAAFLLAACRPTITQPTEEGQPTLKVLAVETFLAEIAQNVAGERIKVESLVPLGLDPHAFEPTPQDVKKIAESNILILNGAGFEEWAQETLENAGGERLVIEASEGLVSREAREGETAMMSPVEKAKELCKELDGKTASEEIAAGADASSAVKLHHEEDSQAEHEITLLSLKLNSSGNGTFYGFVNLDVKKDGEQVIAASSGTVSVTDTSGREIAVEASLSLECSGLGSGILLDLEPGEYILALSGLTAETTPFLAAPTGSHHRHEGDPHFWLDPTLVVKYVANIRDGLIAADPIGKEIYTANAAAYIAKLNELDGWIKSQVEKIPPDDRLIVTNHESFGYFADRYGFTIVGTIVPSVTTGASPSAQQLARLIDHIKETGATAIFIETGASSQLAGQVAAETGVRVVTELYTHSITKPGGSAPTYIDMMKHNVTMIVEALK